MNTANLIAATQSAEGKEILWTINPVTKERLAGNFPIATAVEVNRAVESAYEAWKSFKNTPGATKAVLLRTIAAEIEDLGDTLVHRAMLESGLPEGRIKGERGRTCNQLRLFADLLDEGSWVDAVIDEAMPDRQPLPRPDIRKISIALGPVVVFPASNFPLAFSTAGGDTASALAAGCPVIIKAHPAHLGTNALVAEAISSAIEKCNLPKGIFSSLQGAIETGQSLVKHALIKAVGFTGSYRGGKALFDIANSRPEPIPVYAEMGSNNPIFILQYKMKSNPGSLAEMIAGSVNLGAGQFCTNPGILVMEKGEITSRFLDTLKTAFTKLQPATMLNEGIFKAYENRKLACINSDGVTAQFTSETQSGDWVGSPSFASIPAKNFLLNRNLQEEVFGPFTLAIICEDAKEVLEVAANLQGQLTATLIGTEEELAGAEDLVGLLAEKAGRVIFNNVPTGVEVSPAMHHGGPFPATTNSLFTSVGTDAVKRFVRPVSFQDAPDSLLPSELKRGNPMNIWRTLNGKKVRG